MEISFMIGYFYILLTFISGSIIRVSWIYMKFEAWWKGIVGAMSGFFPARFLEAMKILNNSKTIAEGPLKNEKISQKVTFERRYLQCVISTEKFNKTRINIAIYGVLSYAKLN